MFWHSANDIGRILIVAPLTYIALIIFLRLSGKRMLSKMNAFDLVVTIALGSVLATTLLSRDVALAEGLTALGVLLAAQYVVAWAASRSKRVGGIIKSEPTLLFFRGEFLRDALRSENVSEEGVRAEMRQQGLGSLEQVHAVVLESDGSLSIVRNPSADDRSTLADVRRITNPDSSGPPQDQPGSSRLRSSS